EGENALDDVARAPARLVDLLDAFAHRVLVRRVHARELHVGEDGPQDVVELVRDAGGEGADRLHLLRLVQLLFQELLLLDGVAPAQELGDLHADRRDRLKQLLLGLARPAGGEVQHAERVRGRDDGKDERAVDADLARADLVHGGLGGARVLRHVGGPYRLARLPGKAAQTLAGPVDELAREQDETLNRGIGDAPALGEAQDPPSLVDAEIAAAFPAFGFAHRADHGLQRGRCAVGIGEDARHRVLELAQLLGAPALGDVARNSLVALEGARGIEYRLAAHSEPDLAAA